MEPTLIETPALFLDRDGTLNIDPGYLGDPDKVKLYPNVSSKLKYLVEKFGFKLIVITNQSGITRGLITEEQVHSVNARVNEILNNDGVNITDFYICPFHPDFDPPEKVSCRKPSPEMILKAAKDHKIDLSKSYMIGDKVADVECGSNAGIKSVLIDHNWNKHENKLLKNVEKTANFVAVDFSDACNFIENDLGV